MSGASWIFFGLWIAAAGVAVVALIGWWQTSKMTDEALAGWNEAMDKLERSAAPEDA